MESWTLPSSSLSPSHHQNAHLLLPEHTLPQSGECKPHGFACGGVVRARCTAFFADERHTSPPRDKSRKRTEEQKQKTGQESLPGSISIVNQESRRELDTQNCQPSFFADRRWKRWGKVRVHWHTDRDGFGHARFVQTWSRPAKRWGLCIASHLRWKESVFFETTRQIYFELRSFLQPPEKAPIRPGALLRQPCTEKASYVLSIRQVSSKPLTAIIPSKIMRQAELGWAGLRASPGACWLALLLLRGIKATRYGR